MSAPVVPAVVGTVLQGVGIALIALGLVVLAVTVIGIVRLKGLFPRLQAASKASTLGTVAILVASIGTRDGVMIARAVIVAAFLLLTTPIAAHAIAHAAYRRERAAADADGDSEASLPSVVE